MKDFIRALDRRIITLFFGGIYALTLIFALFPPLYLWASGSGVVILGLPLPIAYWLVDALVLGLGLWGLYRVEDIRGELDESLAPQPGAESTADPIAKGA